MTASEIQWGSVGEWVSGVGALAAIVVALWSILRERARTAAADEQRSLEAASMLTFRGFGGSSDPSHPGAYRWDFAIRNLGLGSFSNVQVTATLASGERPASIVVGTVYAGDPASGSVVEAQPVINSSKTPTSPVVWSMTYQDQRGARWEQDQHGNVRRALEREHRRRH